MVDVVLFELNLTFERLLLFVLAERCNLDAEFGSQQLAEDLPDRVDDSGRPRGSPSSSWLRSGAPLHGSRL